MSSDLKYICNVNEYKQVEDAVCELQDFFEKSSQEQTFLAARLKQLESERDSKWERLWEALRSGGLVEASTTSSSHRLILGDNGKQIFTDVQQSGGGELLKKILGGL